MSTRRLKCIDSKPAMYLYYCCVINVLIFSYWLQDFSLCVNLLFLSSLSELGRFTASRCCLNNSVPLSTTPRRKTVTEPSSALMYVSFLTCFCDISSCKQFLVLILTKIFSWSHKINILSSLTLQTAKAHSFIFCISAKVKKSDNTCLYSQLGRF